MFGGPGLRWLPARILHTLETDEEYFSAGNHLNEPAEDFDYPDEPGQDKPTIVRKAGSSATSTRWEMLNTLSLNVFAPWNDNDACKESMLVSNFMYPVCNPGSIEGLNRRKVFWCQHQFFAVWLSNRVTRG